MPEDQRTPEEEPTGVWALVVALFVLGPLGALALVYGLDDFQQEPGLSSFVEPYVGVWLLYTCAVILYSLAAHTSDDKVSFPKRAPKAVLVLNLIVFAPFVLWIEFGGNDAGESSSGGLSWETVGFWALIGVPFFAFLWALKSIFWGSLRQLISPNEEDEPAA